MAYQAQKCPMEVEKQNKFQCIFCDTIFCICDLNLIYNDMAIDLRTFNYIQQTASMRLNNLPYDITVIRYLL